jgi:hypothetical protein
MVFLRTTSERKMVSFLERVVYNKGLENALIVCHEVIDRFEGSKETLRLIRRVEESLRKLIAKAD